MVFLFAKIAKISLVNENCFIRKRMFFKGKEL